MSSPIRRLAATLALALVAGTCAHAQTPTLLNASYDVAREFYKDVNAAFAAHHRRLTGLDSVSRLYRNVPVLARGGRDATGIFLQRNIGDVLVTFESEVVSVDKEFGAGRVYAVHPSVSVVAENPVAIVERTVHKKGSATLAKAYLDYLYSPEGQEIAARHHIRPRDEAVLRRHAQAFKPIRLFTVEQYFGSLAQAQKVHFNDGGQFDKLYTQGR